MRFRVLTATGLLLLGLVGSVTTALPAAAHPGPAHSRPDVINLPNGFSPEGIAVQGNSFWVGSLVDGAIYRGNLRSGEGDVVIPGVEGNVAVGTEIDNAGRLWVAGGATGKGRVYSTRTKQLLKEFTLTSADAFINDVVVTSKAAYFTDSVNPVLYVVPLTGRRIGDARPLSFNGELEYGEGFNVNGIEASANGRTLVVVQSNTGLLFTVDPTTGATKQIDLGADVTLANGDGLLRVGRILYVVQNQLNQIAAVRLSRNWASGTVVDTLTSPNFDIPTTVGASRGSLYAVNARFGTAVTPDTTYTVVRVPRW
jgi:sugar lactone lactonase YvrE